MKETKFKCDCGFEWIKGYSGQHQCGSFYMEKVDGLKQELDAANAKIDRPTSRGIEDMKFELDAFMAHVHEMYEVMDALKPYNVMQRTMVMELKSKAPAQSLHTIQAQAVTDLISECSYSGVVDGIATSIIDVDSAISYADRLGEGQWVRF